MFQEIRNEKDATMAVVIISEERLRELTAPGVLWYPICPSCKEENIAHRDEKFIRCAKCQERIEIIISPIDLST